MVQPIRPQNKQIVDPKTGRIALEWDAYFARLEQLLATQLAGGVTSFEGRTGVVASAAGDYTASEITNVPAGNIAATTVQAAIDELDGEKAATSHSHAASDITSGTFDDARIAESNVTQHEAAIDHDALTNFVSDEHVAHSGVTLTAGAGLTGGGDITASRSFAVGAGTGITVNADDVALADNGVTMAKLEDAEAWTLLLRNAGTTGDPDYVKISALTNSSGFGSGDKLLIEESSGELRKIDYDDLPGSGGSSNNWTYATEAVTTSGTAHTLVSGLPSDVEEIEIMLRAVSTNSANQSAIIQLGDSGGFETAGYISGVEGNAVFDPQTDGFLLAVGTAFDAATLLSGTVRLTRYNSAPASWHLFGVTTDEALIIYACTGYKTLSADLTQIRITTSAGTATFDGGTVSLRYR